MYLEHSAVLFVVSQSNLFCITVTVLHNWLWCHFFVQFGVKLIQNQSKLSHLHFPALVFYIYAHFIASFCWLTALSVSFVFGQCDISIAFCFFSYLRMACLHCLQGTKIQYLQGLKIDVEILSVNINMYIQ